MHRGRSRLLLLSRRRRQWLRSVADDELLHVEVMLAVEMTHPVPLRAQVGDVVGVGARFARHAVDDVEAESLQSTALGRIVGDQPHRGDPEVDQDLRPDPVLARVDRVAEHLVRFNRVVALLLERVIDNPMAG